MKELRGPMSAVAAEISHYFERLPIEDLDLLVGAIRDLNKLLLRIG